MAPSDSRSPAPDPGLDRTSLTRIARLPVSSLCDADKTLPVVDPGITELVPSKGLLGMTGPAVTVVAHDDHLPVLVAVSTAPAGSVIVVATGGGTRAVSGELFATEARRRGLAGIVIDGYCRDLHSLIGLGIPVYARGTTPMSGTTMDPGTIGEPITVGGVTVESGWLVVADSDGMAIAAPDRIAAALDTAEHIEQVERRLLDRMASGVPLAELTNLSEHLAALRAGRPSALEFRPDGPSGPG
ncbi:MAG: RraA family protein [Acidimicrobiales bacterium]